MAHPRRPDPAQGVFETLLVLDGRPVELAAHLARLESSLAELFPGVDAPDLGEPIQAEAARIAAGRVRVVVTPSADRFAVEINGRRPTPGALVADSATKAPGAVGLRGVEVPGGLGAHKWADRSLLDEAQARLPAGSLPLIVDVDGTVLEASRANLFAVRNGALFTPPLDGRILPGVTRARVLELAAGAGIEAQETELRRDDLLAADEVFLTGSVRGVEPVASLDGAPLAGPGPLAAELAGALRRAWLGAPVA